MKTAIITGALGQDGAFLTEHLLDLNHKVYGVSRRKSTDADSWGFLEHLRGNPNFSLVHGDITDSIFISNLISDIKPTKLFNLGAQSHVGYSFQNPYTTFETDACAVVHMLSAVQKHSPATRFYQASTSELFGGIDCPSAGYSETSPFHPRSPYGVAKLAAHWSTINFREAYGMFACAGILFNHESERRGLDFVTRKVTNGVARITAGLDTKIVMGNIDAYRDWGYAKDYVKMMNLMLEADVPQEYVIATGKTYSIKNLLELAFSLVGIDNWEDYVEFDERFMRPSEVPYLLGDPTKAEKELGWVPETSFEGLIKIMLDSDLKRYGI
jgi:GDPmannose 4,6-dehydratase